MIFGRPWYLDANISEYYILHSFDWPNCNNSWYLYINTNKRVFYAI